MARVSSPTIVEPSRVVPHLLDFREEISMGWSACSKTSYQLHRSMFEISSRSLRLVRLSRSM